MKKLYVGVVLGVLVLSGCSKPTLHQKSLAEIHDLKKMGDEIERDNDKLRDSNTKLIDSDM